jgi:hypothetical protein
VIAIEQVPLVRAKQWPTSRCMERSGSENAAIAINQIIRRTNRQNYVQKLYINLLQTTAKFVQRHLITSTNKKN